MADAVTITTIEDGPRWLVMRFTDISDGTGETLVLKVNAASAHGVVVQGQTFYPGVHLKIRELEWSVYGFGLELLWDATTPVTAYTCWGVDHQKFDRFGGITNPKTTGATGNILFSTTQPAAGGAGYSLLMRMSKGVPQS
jgi:hypothetical protein